MLLAAGDTRDPSDQEEFENYLREVVAGQYYQAYRLASAEAREPGSVDLPPEV